MSETVKLAGLNELAAVSSFVCVFEAPLLVKALQKGGVGVYPNETPRQFSSPRIRFRRFFWENPPKNPSLERLRPQNESILPQCKDGHLSSQGFATRVENETKPPDSTSFPKEWFYFCKELFFNLKKKKTSCCTIHSSQVRDVSVFVEDGGRIAQRAAITFHHLPPLFLLVFWISFW